MAWIQSYRFFYYYENPLLIWTDTNPWNFIDPNDIKRQEAIAKLWPIGAPALAGLFTGVGFGQARAQPQAASTEEGKEEQEKAEEKSEEKQEVF